MLEYLFSRQTVCQYKHTSPAIAALQRRLQISTAGLHILFRLERYRPQGRRGVAYLSGYHDNYTLDGA